MRRGRQAAPAAAARRSESPPNRRRARCRNRSRPAPPEPAPDRRARRRSRGPCFRPRSKAAGDRAGQQQRGGFDPIGNDRVPRTAQTVDADDFDHVGCRAPRSGRQAIARNRPRSTISGSRAAPKITVLPRARVAAERMLAVPVTVEPWGPVRLIVAPRKSAGAGHHPIALDRQFGSQRRQTGQMQIDRPRTDPAAARQRHHGPAAACQQWPQHAKAGPHRPGQPRRNFDRSVVGHRQVPEGTTPPTRTRRSAGWSTRERFRRPSTPARAASPRTSPSRGMRHSSTGCSANSDAARIGSAAFFEPAADTLPASATGPSILKQSIAHPSLARRRGVLEPPPTPLGPRSPVRGRPNP